LKFTGICSACITLKKILLAFRKVEDLEEDRRERRRGGRYDRNERRPERNDYTYVP